MALAYTAPTWVDGSGEGLSASNLQAISNCIEGLVQGSDKAIHNIAINNGVMTITYVDGTIDTDIAVDMKGISNIAKTSTVGNVDTYTVTYTDGSTFTFTITNGRDGAIQYTAGEGITISDDNVISANSIDGSTATPTDDIGTWLKCANLHQEYTTLADVLADTAVLEALMSSTNAADYLVRSTTWASSIVADEMAMAYIGANNYCSEILLADSTWRTAICGSAYFEGVLNVKVPPMTGYTTPSGEVRAKSEYYPAWRAFNETLSAYWGSADGTEPSAGQWIEYKFTQAVKIYKVKLQNSAPIYAVKTFKIQGSNDGTNYIDITGNITNKEQTTLGAITYYEIAPSEAYQYYRFYVVAGKYSTYVSILDIQFYGRSDKPIGNDDTVDTNANISAIAPNEPNATSSQVYAAGEHFYKDGKFCTAKAAIASGATFTLGTNYTEGTVADDTIYYVDVSVAGQAITSYSNDLQIYYGSKGIDGLPANAYGVGWCWAKNRYWDAVNIVLVNDDDAPYITLGFFHPSSYTIRNRQEMVIRVFYKIINY